MLIFFPYCIQCIYRFLSRIIYKTITELFTKIEDLALGKKAYNLFSFIYKTTWAA